MQTSEYIYLFASHIELEITKQISLQLAILCNTIKVRLQNKLERASKQLYSGTPLIRQPSGQKCGRINGGGLNYGTNIFLKADGIIVQLTPPPKPQKYFIN